MSHNIHFLRLAAESHSEAMETAEVMIEDWGNENNYRSFLYSICQDGTIHDPQGDCPPFDQTIAEITGGLTVDINASPSRIETLVPLLAKVTVLIAQEKTYKEIADELKLINIYHLNHFIGEVKASQEVTIINGKIDPWTTVYRDWQLNEYGITELSVVTKESSEKLYIVVIDMHD